MSSTTCAVPGAVVVGGDVADVRQQQRVRQRAQRMVGRERLDVVDVERRHRRCGRSAQRRDQRRLVDDRPARGVDQVCGRLHGRELLGADQSPAGGRQRHVHGDHVGLGEQLALADRPHAVQVRRDRRSGSATRRSPTCRTPAPTAATGMPSRPSPTTPSVMPDSPGPIVCCQPPARTAASSWAKLRVSAMIIPRVSSGTALPVPAVPHTVMPRVGGGRQVDRRVLHAGGDEQPQLAAALGAPRPGTACARASRRRPRCRAAARRSSARSAMCVESTRRSSSARRPPTSRRWRARPAGSRRGSSPWPRADARAALQHASGVGVVVEREAVGLAERVDRRRRPQDRRLAVLVEVVAARRRARARG